MFNSLEQINARPKPFSVYSAEDLWADPHTSERMLAFHLDGEVNLASRTTEFIRRSLDWLATQIDVDNGASVLDLGCGPGLYSNALARRGARVVGIDFSERSIHYARKTAPAEPIRPVYIHQDYLEAPIEGTFDLVLMAMCDFCVLSPTQRSSLLGRVQSALAPNGRFVFDVYGLRSLQERTETVMYAPQLMDGFWAPNPYHGFLHTFVYKSERVTLDKYEIIESTRTRTIYNWLQYYDVPSLSRELASSGLRVEEACGDLTGTELTPDPTEFCAVATRA